MKYIEEFRNKRLVGKLSQEILSITPKDRSINIMEVCGTHTQNFHRFGLSGILPKNINFISGPGCPVCVSAYGYIDSAIKLSEDKDVIILTFGDMLRVPGSSFTLEQAGLRFGNVKVVYSPSDAIDAARKDPKKKIVFLGVGFETTAPLIALTIIKAGRENIKNLFFLNSLKLIPPALDYLAKDREIKVDGFLCPGHVSAIIGTKPYERIVKKYKIPCCVAGFEPLDILEGIRFLLIQIITDKPAFKNQYNRVVKAKGNIRALSALKEVFVVNDASWRGLGTINKSGLFIKRELQRFDAERIFNVHITEKRSSFKDSKKCRCPDVLKGVIKPLECALFRKICTPETPCGPCMVSQEGACNAYYRFH